MFLADGFRARRRDFTGQVIAAVMVSDRGRASVAGPAAKPDSNPAFEPGGNQEELGLFKTKGHVPAGHSQRRTFDV